MARSLSPDEIGWARYLVSHGTALGPAPAVTQRFGWLAQLDGALAGEGCDCGTCPSVELLVDGTAPAPDAAPDFVLYGGTNDMLVLLHIVADRPAYLEGAPGCAAGATSFPLPTQH